MKVRRTIAGTPLRARLTATCWGALTLLAPVAVSACTSTPSSTPPAVFSPTGTATATATVTRTATATATSSASPIPSAAPVTGGGGTAGLQDTLLLGLGAAAILAGAGSIVYRRRLRRDR